MDQTPSRPRPKWLTRGPFCLIAIDLITTLRGQPAAYWSGNRAVAIEGNPVPRVLLECHPVLFVLFAMMTAAAVVFVLRVLPLELARRASLFAMCGSAVAISTWLRLLTHADGWVFAGLFAFCAVLVACAWWPPREQADAGG